MKMDTGVIRCSEKFNTVRGSSGDILVYTFSEADIVFHHERNGYVDVKYLITR